MKDKPEGSPCIKCNGETILSIDPKTLANESTCQECGHVELHGFGLT